MTHTSRIPAPRSSTLGALGLVLAAAGLGSGCAKICDDDGFAWQQDQLCEPTATAASTVETDTDTTTTTMGTTATETVSASATTGMSMTGTMSETASGGTLYCKDADGDTFGDPDMCTNVPPGDTPPPGTVPNDDDCDDSNPNTFPGSAPLDDPNACMQDDDGDDHGDADPDGNGTQPGSDYCDDNPYAFTEATCATCKDEDMDGAWIGCDVYPDPNSPDPNNPDIGGDEFADCDDKDKDTYPGAAPKDSPTACMKDADGDDYGDDFGGMNPPPGVVPGTDCDDDNDHTYPGSAELDDPGACMQDNDEDGHGDAKPDKPGVTPGTDCFDDNPDLNPSHTALMTAPTAIGPTANVSQLVDNGTTYDQVEYKTFDVSGFMQWRIESMTVNPLDSKVYGWLDDENGRGLVEIDYCGGGAPAAPDPKLSKRVCGISFIADGRLFGVDYSSDQFIEFATTGEIVGQTALMLEGKVLNIGADCGMTYDCFNDRLLLADSLTGGIYSINVDTGEATVLSTPGVEFGAGLSLDPAGNRLLTCLNNDFYALALADFAVTPLNQLSVASVNDLEFLPLCE